MESKEKTYNALSAIFFSFGSRDFYMAAGSQWRGLALGYLLLVSIIFSCLVTGAQYFKIAAKLYSPEIETLFHSMPDMTLQNGKIMGVEKPVQLQIPGQTVNIVVIDPENKYADLESANAIVLMQKEQFIFRTKAERQVLKLPYRHFFRDGRFSGPGILQQLRDMANVAIIPLGIVIGSVNFIFVLCRSLLIAALLKLFKYRTKFGTACRLLVVASTPATLLTGISLLTGIHLAEFEDAIFALLFFGYAFFAFYSCRSIERVQQ